MVRLNQAVKRNAERFPQYFMFALTPAEKAEVVTSCDHLRALKFSKSLPYASFEFGSLSPKGRGSKTGRIGQTRMPAAGAV